MTPELKVALDVIFEEHKKISQPVIWNREPFRGRLSTGLTEMAKDTLLRKKIILYSNPVKKVQTVLNPIAQKASTIEEADKMVNSTVSVLYPVPVFQSNEAFDTTPGDTNLEISKPLLVQRVITMTEKAEFIPAAEIKWYFKPVFFYIIWPLCAAITGMVIAHYIGNLYTTIFFNLKG